MFKNELGGKNIIEVYALRLKTNSFKTDNDIEKKTAKGTNKRTIKHRLKFQDYYDSVFKNKTILRSQLWFKNDHHAMYTEHKNKIAIGSNDDKKI